MQVEQKFLKYNFMARFMYRMWAKPGFAYLETVHEKQEIRTWKKKARKVYKEMLKRTPGIGKASMMLLMPAALFSIYQAAEGKMEESVFGSMVCHAAHSPLFTKMTLMRKRTLFTEKFHEKTLANAEMSQFSPYPLNWKFTHEKISSDEYLTTYTRCGVVEFAKQENCLNMAKYLCKIDFISYDLMGTTLDRSKTLADGDDVCDFHVIKKR